MPAEPVARAGARSSRAGRRQGRQVDPADERRLVVDDDELLVVAVERTLPRVERHRDPRAAGELVAHASRTSPRSGWKSGSGAPAQASTRTSTRSAASASSSRSVGPSSSSRKAGSKCQPARWTCERAAANRVRDPRQRLAPVDERLDAAAGTRRERRGARPAARRRIDRLGATVPARRRRVMGADGALDRVPDEIVEAVERIRGHGVLMPRGREDCHPVGEGYCEYE